MAGSHQVDIDQTVQTKASFQVDSLCLPVTLSGTVILKLLGSGNATAGLLKAVVQDAIGQSTPSSDPSHVTGIKLDPTSFRI